MAVMVPFLGEKYFVLKESDHEIVEDTGRVQQSSMQSSMGAESSGREVLKH